MSRSRSQRTNQLVFRALRRGLVGPATSWYHRQETYQTLRHLEECGEGVTVRPPIRIGNPRHTRIEDGVALNPGFLAKGKGDLRIGAYTHFGWNVTILTDDHRYRDAELLPYDRTWIPRPVDIGVACWFGDRVLVAPGTTIGDGCVIGAGAVVSGRVPPHSVVVGSPGRVVKTRDAEHFERLRKEGRFLDAELRGVLISGRMLPHPTPRSNTEPMTR